MDNYLITNAVIEGNELPWFKTKEKSQLQKLWRIQNVWDTSTNSSRGCMGNFENSPLEKCSKDDIEEYIKGFVATHSNVLDIFDFLLKKSLYLTDEMFKSHSESISKAIGNWMFPVPTESLHLVYNDRRYINLLIDKPLSCFNRLCDLMTNEDTFWEWFESFIPFKVTRLEAIELYIMLKTYDIISDDLRVNVKANLGKAIIECLPIILNNALAGSNPSDVSLLANSVVFLTADPWKNVKRLRIGWNGHWDVKRSSPYDKSDVLYIGDVLDILVQCFVTVVEDNEPNQLPALIEASFIRLLKVYLRSQDSMAPFLIEGLGVFLRTKVESSVRAEKSISSFSIKLGELQTEVPTTGNETIENYPTAVYQMNEEHDQKSVELADMLGLDCIGLVWILRHCSKFQDRVIPSLSIKDLFMCDESADDDWIINTLIEKVLQQQEVSKVDEFIPRDLIVILEQHASSHALKLKDYIISPLLTIQDLHEIAETNCRRI